MCVCVCVCVCFPIHSSVDGHLGCFHNLAFENSIVFNIGIHKSFQISVSVDF